MEIIGTVLAILDETKVLLRIKPTAYVPDELTVFSEVKREELEKLGLDRLLIPKGEIQIILRQSDEIFLAQRFQSERIEKRRKPSNLMLNPIGQYFGEEVEVVTKGSWSASLDKAQTLNVQYPKEIQVGDPVGKK